MENVIAQFDEMGFKTMLTEKYWPKFKDAFSTLQSSMQWYMKGKKNRSLSRKLGIRKTQVGRLDAGTVFLHQDDFWIVLNRSMSGESWLEHS